jgi:fermentation-respiration switch protein FrsA (DUF1100 family)
MHFLLFIFLLLGTGCSGVFYQPSRHQFTDPSQFKLTYEEVWFQSKDGTKLHGWWFPAKAKKSKGTIVQFHGNAQNITTHTYSLIWLIDHGYDLFTWDYRGYGRSGGEASQVLVHEDALAALAKGRELHRGGAFVVFGQSLGGAISLRALVDYEFVDEVTLLVHDSSFNSYQDVAFSVLKTRWFLWPFSPLAFVLVSDEYAPEKVLDQLKTPTLVIVGKKDAIIPAKFGKETHKKLKTVRKWLWELPEGGHIDVFHHANGVHRKRFLDLLDEITSA